MRAVSLVESNTWLIRCQIVNLVTDNGDVFYPLCSQHSLKMKLNKVQTFSHQYVPMKILFISISNKSKQALLWVPARCLSRLSHLPYNPGNMSLILGLRDKNPLCTTVLRRPHVTRALGPRHNT